MCGRARSMITADVGVRVLLTLLPLTKKPRRQKQRRGPGNDQHQAPGALAGRRLSQGFALQPPSGAAKRQTMGRFSPSARTPKLLSVPTQAP
nr:hypothetical protein [Tanacetum cinerariifolium]